MKEHQPLMEEILAPGGLSILLQPIFEIVDGQPLLFALEALARGPKDSNLERADVLFEYVRRKGREVDVDRACVTAALRAAANFPGDPAISINVHSATIERDVNFPRFLMEACFNAQISSSRVILEIVEQQRHWNEYAFFAALEKLRTRGVRIALDDIGLGYSNHRALIEIRPDIFKIDRYFIRGCSERLPAQAAIESITLLANRLGARVVAEGIETSDDLTTVTAHGIALVQGYYFSRPRTAGELIAFPVSGNTNQDYGATGQ